MYVILKNCYLFAMHRNTYTGTYLCDVHFDKAVAHAGQNGRILTVVMSME